jgi:hypothetical protein
MHLQKAVDPHDLFVRAVGLGPQVRLVLYDPSAPLHDRYTQEKDFVDHEDRTLLEDTVLTINAFFGWDFNSCEALRGERGVWYPIDFANPCPDSQVTSLHYHFPWLIKANLRWAIFNAAVKRRKPYNLNWKPYFEIAEEKAPYREKLARYAAVARAAMETDRFHEFCDRHLAHLDEVTWEFFGTEDAKDAVRKKVTALYPKEEVEEFIEMFFGRIQSWRRDESDRPESTGARARKGTS